MSITKDHYHDILQEPWAMMPETDLPLASLHDSVPLETIHGSFTVPRAMLNRITAKSRSQGYTDDEIRAGIAEWLTQRIESVCDEALDHGVGLTYYLVRASERRHAVA